MSQAFNIHDKYFKRAKKQGWRARSAFKLEDIDKKFNIFKTGLDVLDLGAAPGSWLQYARLKTGGEAKLIGVDLSPIDFISNNVTILKKDIYDDNFLSFIKKIHPEKFPIIISDLAPKTSGVKQADHLGSIELSERVVEIAQELLTKNGTVVLKIFEGGELKNFSDKCRSVFKNTKIYKPKASRERSRETYFILKEIK